MSEPIKRTNQTGPESYSPANYHFCKWLTLTARYLTGNCHYDFVYFGGMTGALVDGG